MKRTVAWVATFALSSLVLSAGRLPAAFAADDAKSAPGTPTELLASKGLTKNGKNVEADFSDFKSKSNVKAFAPELQPALNKL